MFRLAILALLTTSATVATTAEAVPQPLSKRTWEVITPQGQPVQDPARIALLTSVVADFNQLSSRYPQGTNLVLFSAAGSSEDVSATLQRQGGGFRPARRAPHHDGWNMITWNTRERDRFQFVYHQWACEPIRIPLPDKTGCLLDVGELRPVRVPTFNQQIRLVDADGKVVDTGGSVSLSLEGGGRARSASVKHGLATIDGVFAGELTLAADLSQDGYGYQFGNDRTVKIEPGKTLDITIPNVRYPTTSPANTTPLPWLTDYQAAVRTATQAGKPLLLEFTGSDWCGWCKVLHREVFDTQAFAEWASTKVVLVELDFPHKTPQEAALKAQNEALAKRFGIGGYPTILLLDPTGTTVLGRMGYQKGGPFMWTATADAILDKKAP